MQINSSTQPSAGPISLIAFDADDTLWDNQTHFERVEREYAALLAPYGTPEEVSSQLLATETANMPLLGYGCKAFTLSLVENAIRMSEGRVSGSDIERIVGLGKELLSLPATPLPHVETTLKTLRAMGKYKLVVMTKGELLDQQNKLRRSGLAGYFDETIIVSDKTQAEYERLCRVFRIDASQLMMVGNSFKSDIEPVLQLGGYAVHIPFHTTWQHEQIEEYDHPHLLRLDNIGRLAAAIDRWPAQQDGPSTTI